MSSCRLPPPSARPPLALRLRTGVRRLSRHGLLLSAAVLVAADLSASAAGLQERGRTQQELAGPWKFAASDSLTGCEAPGCDDSAWQTVELPHTWQTFADQRDYSHAWYRKAFALPRADAERRIYLHFDAAGIAVDVYLNGVHLGRHVGAYTAFTVEATRAANFGATNWLAVMCDSKERVAGNLSRPEARPDWYWNAAGGLHRKVWLLKTEASHIDPTDFGSSGVYVTAREITPARVRYDIRTMLRHAGNTERKLEVEHAIFDSTGRQVDILRGSKQMPADSAASLTLTGEVANPQLWSPASPALYRIQTRVLVAGKPVDSLSVTTGFRSFQKNEAGHFLLNGQPIRLIGSSLHARNEHRFHAVTDRDMEQDIRQLHDLGFNSIFLSHYSFPPVTYELTDRLGLLAWTENGYVGMGDKRGSYEPAASTQITREMVLQHWNHPSIYCWSIGNEVSDDASLQALVGVVRELGDPNRLVACNCMPDRELNDCDLSTKSIFNGWYAPGPFQALFRYINQHGAGGHLAMQQSYASMAHKVDSWEPEGYQQVVAEAKCRQLYQEGLQDLYYWWQGKDQEAPKFKGVLNSKGLLTFAGYPKDVAYLFQAFGRPELPVLYICGEHWFLREVNELKVYSNRQALEMRVNGQSCGKKLNGDYLLLDKSIRNVFLWNDVLQPGCNLVEVGDGTLWKQAVIYFQHGESEKPGLIRNLKADNGPAHLIDLPVHAQWPFYCQFDGKALNTFDTLPEQLRDARWISTRRQDEPAWQSRLGFDADGDIDVFVMYEPAGPASAPVTSSAADVPVSARGRGPAWLTEHGFAATGVRGQWRGHDLRLHEYELFVRQVHAGEHIVLGPDAAPSNWLCLLRSRPAGDARK